MSNKMEIVDISPDFLEEIVATFNTDDEKGFRAIQDVGIAYKGYKQIDNRPRKPMNWQKSRPWR